jgi:hypothetical protein
MLPFAQLAMIKTGRILSEIKSESGRGNVAFRDIEKAKIVVHRNGRYLQA